MDSKTPDLGGKKTGMGALVFSSFQTRAGWGEKKCERRGLGWSAGRCGLTCACARFLNLLRVPGGLKFCGSGKKFNPQDSVVETRQHQKIIRWPVMLKLCQPCKICPIVNAFQLKFQLSSADIFIIIVP